MPIMCTTSVLTAATVKSKGILTVTMTMEDGASLSQSEVHRKMLENLIQKDADLIRDLVNWQLLPRMVRHGFPVKGFRFDWDETVDYTPEQQVAYERMLLDKFEVDPISSTSTMYRCSSRKRILPP